MFYLPFLGFLLFFLSVSLSVSSSSFSFILKFLSFSSRPLCRLPSVWPAGLRPYGLEEDVRQYEQDLAKRLYQARVRASQGAAPHASSSTSSSAASQLRSAPRLRPLGPDARHHGGLLGCFGFSVFCCRGQIQKGPSSNTNGASVAFLLLFFLFLLLHVLCVLSLVRFTPTFPSSVSSFP